MSSFAQGSDGGKGDKDKELSISDQQRLAKIREQVARARAQQQIVSDKGSHRFWDTQPVMDNKDGDAAGLAKGVEKLAVDAGQSSVSDGKVSGFIKEQTVEEVRKEPYPLPPGFEWCVLDVNDTEQLDSIYTLLNRNYVEDDDNMFRFDYSR